MLSSSQVHKFVVGVAPVRSLCRVGWAAKQLLAIPADQLRGNSPAYAGNSDVAVGRQLRRGVTALARAVTLEALGLGASVAGGADYVLRGGSGRRSEQPAGKLLSFQKYRIFFFSCSLFLFFLFNHVFQVTCVIKRDKCAVKGLSASFTTWFRNWTTLVIALDIKLCYSLMLA